MGLFMTTLHVRKEALPELEMLMQNHETLRDQNPDWLTILPGPSEDYGYKSLQKIAKKLSVPSLLFYWNDDDSFYLEVYEGGKKAACISSYERYNKKITSISGILYGDERLTPALRLAARHGVLEEQVALLEEALGLSLMQLPDMEPETVQQGHTMYDEICARKKELKKRKNKYQPVQLTKEELPPAVRDEVEIKHGRENWLYKVPEKEMLLEGLDTEGCAVSCVLNVALCQSVYSEDGSKVCGAYVPKMARHGYDALVCLEPDESMRWFLVAKNAVGGLFKAKSSPPGKMLIYSCREDRQGRIIVVDCVSGHVLHQREIDFDFSDVYWMDELQRYVILCEGKKENACYSYLRLMDETLQQVNQIMLPQRHEGKYISYSQSIQCQTVLWGSCGMNDIQACDVTTETLRIVHPEDRGLFFGIGPEREIFKLQGNNVLVIFDANGRQISWHRFKSTAYPVVYGKDIYVCDIDSGFQGSRINENAECRIWKLEKITE